MSQPNSVSYAEMNLESFPVIPAKPPVTDLDISNNPIKNFKSMKKMNHLLSLNMNSTKLESFLGSIELPMLKTFSAECTPILENKDFDLMAVICFGDKLHTINGHEVDASILERAKIYRETYLPFLKDGYVFVKASTGKMQKVGSTETVTIAPPQLVQLVQNSSNAASGSFHPDPNLMSSDRLITVMQDMNNQKNPDTFLVPTDDYDQTNETSSPETTNSKKFVGYPAKRPNTFYTKTQPVMSKIDYLTIAKEWSKTHKNIIEKAAKEEGVPVPYLSDPKSETEQKEEDEA